VRTKCLPLYLPREMYTRLERLAEAHERDPIQQARWLLRQALDEPEPRAQPTGAALATAGDDDAA